jgi:hypothetical protein
MHKIEELFVDFSTGAIFYAVIAVLVFIPLTLGWFFGGWVGVGFVGALILCYVTGRIINRLGGV